MLLAHRTFLLDLLHTADELKADIHPALLDKRYIERIGDITMAVANILGRLLSPLPTGFGFGSGHIRIT